VDSSIAAMVLPIQPQIFAVLQYPSFWVQISNALFRLTQLFSAPFLGFLADKWGRKPIFLLATSGTFFSYLIMLPLNVPAMFANRLLDGTSNGFYTAVRSAITDISTKKSIDKNLGLLSSLAALGVIIGPGISSIFGFWDIRFLPGKNIQLILVALILGLINITLASIFKETRPVNNLKALKQSKKILDIPDEMYEQIDPVLSERFRYGDLIPKFLSIWKKQRELAYLIIMELLMVSTLSYYFYFINFVSYSKLQFTPLDISIFMIYFGVMIGVVHAGFYNFVCDKISKRFILLFCSGLGSIVLFLYTMAQTKLILYSLVLFDIISISLIDGIIQGQIGKNLKPNERGYINGLVQGFQEL
jgi:MFS transporter, DHA1 family, tetracycline resistance protein